MGTKEGFIEIELKGLPGNSNLTIRRKLTSDMVRQQSFIVNGNQMPGREVSEKVMELGIQMDNLWCEFLAFLYDFNVLKFRSSFLPQDKVAEFARMTPQGLLLATEEAAGDPRLSKWHEILKKEGRDFKTLNGVRLIKVCPISKCYLFNRKAMRSRTEGD
jgi:structural maintenance of chromosomes protein 5